MKARKITIFLNYLLHMRATKFKVGFSLILNWIIHFFFKHHFFISSNSIMLRYQKVMKFRRLQGLSFQDFFLSRNSPTLIVIRKASRRRIPPPGERLNQISAPEAAAYCPAHRATRACAAPLCACSQCYKLAVDENHNSSSFRFLLPSTSSHIQPCVQLNLKSTANFQSQFEQPTFTART